MKLSILIASLPERAEFLKRMLGYLGPMPEGAEVVIDLEPRGMSTGQKRNNLIDKAQGEWVCFVDDDDYVAPDYVSSIMEALEQNPDCVTFQGKYFQDTVFVFDWTIKLGERYEERGGHVYRWPNHLSVMRKSIASSVKFPPITQGEDYAWSRSIMEQGLLKTEVHIPKQLYYYYFRSKK